MPWGRPVPEDNPGGPRSYRRFLRQTWKREDGLWMCTRFSGAAAEARAAVFAVGPGRCSGQAMALSTHEIDPRPVEPRTPAPCGTPLPRQGPSQGSAPFAPTVPMPPLLRAGAVRSGSPGRPIPRTLRRAECQDRAVARPMGICSGGTSSMRACCCKKSSTFSRAISSYTLTSASRLRSSSISFCGGT